MSTFYKFIAILFIVTSFFFSAQAQKFPDHVGNKVKQLRIIKTDTSYEDGKPVFSSDTSVYQYNTKGDKIKYRAGVYDMVYIYKYDLNNRVVYRLDNLKSGENMDSSAFTYLSDGSGYYLSWNGSFAGIPDSITFDSHGNTMQNFRNNTLRFGSQFTYDKNGCLLKTSNGEGVVATFTCNEKGLRSSSYFIPDAETTWYTYDVNGLLKTAYSQPDKNTAGSKSLTKYYYTFY